ncbi:MAG: helix-turn-helix domain-containing protein [Planctomycetaceae bacterium]
MIRNEAEYKATVRRVQEQAERLNQQTAELKSTGLTKEQIKRVTDPVRSFHEQLKEELESYERLKRGEFDELQNLSGFGELLVAVRIAKGVTQRDLAKRLGVSESQVSRDERNEYHGITIDRANRILEALDVEVTTEVSSLGRARPKLARSAS